MRSRSAKLFKLQLLVADDFKLKEEKLTKVTCLCEKIKKKKTRRKIPIALLIELHASTPVQRDLPHLL